MKLQRMKIGPYCLALLTAAFIANGWFTLPVLSQCWTEQQSVAQTNLTAVAFSDSNHGIAIGSNVLRTTNGGASWTESSPPNAFIQVFMFDSLYALASAFSGDIYYTTDEGNTWSLKHSHPIYMGKYSFWDRNRGLFIGSGGQIFRTTDGGTTWENRINDPALASITCMDTACAMAVGGTGFIYRTTDGGGSWNPLSIQTSDTLKFVSFVNANLGIVISRFKKNSTLYRTTDGGVHWTPRSTPNGSYTGFSFLDTYRWIGLLNNQLLVTSDAAASFTTQALPFNDYDTEGVTYLPDGTIILIQDSSSHARGRIIALAKNNCVADVIPVTPENGAQKVPLLHLGTIHNAVALEWVKPHTLVTAASRVQYSTDSLFAEENIITVGTSQVSGSDTSSVIISPLGAQTRYYWRVAIQYIDGTTMGWSQSSAFTTAGGSILGTVFRDLNKNGILDGSESGVTGCQVQLAGKNAGTDVTDSAGVFSFLGLDSGMYQIGYKPTLPWQSSSLTDSFTIALPFNGTVSGINFAEFFPWNSISGNVFYDVNENGIKDISESWLSSWSVQLVTPTRRVLSLTDSLGAYSFSDIETELCSVSVLPIPNWEKITPRNVDDYTIDFPGTGLHITSEDFAVHPIPSRVKIAMRCHDNSYNNTTVLRWGVRPGATTGIWNAYSGATRVDYSEGEDELPSQFDSTFDVRFVSPPGSQFIFGNGSWTDIRPYLTSSQVDTFQINFWTGPRSEGSYPITFTWSKELVRQSYTGPVTIQDSTGSTYDMKTLDSLVIADSTLTTLLLVAASPVLPPDGVPRQGLSFPSAYSLEQNYPNPFNPSTEINYTIRNLSLVTITVFDLLGREVATLIQGMKAPGSYSIPWDASRYPSGVYFCRLTVVEKTGASISFVKKMILLK